MGLLPAAFPWIGLLTALLITVTLLPLSRSERWWVRGWDFPRLQLAVFAALLLAVQLLLMPFSYWQEWILPGTSALCLFYQMWWIAPYTRLFKHEVRWATPPDPDRSLKIINANVLTPNRDADRLVRIVREWSPDILVTLESDPWWEKALAILEDDYPYSIKCPLDNLYGMHVYSRLRLTESSIEFLVQRDVPSMHALVHLPSGDRVRAHFLHPAPPSPTENLESTERDAELVIVGRNVAESSLPVVVSGDLNDVAWSQTTRLFRKMSGLLDPRIGRGMYNTYHADHRLMRWPLDHIFHSDHFLLSRIARLPHFGSDHFPLFTELVLDPTYREEQNGLEADAEDRKEADRKTSEVDAGPEDVPQPGE